MSKQTWVRSNSEWKKVKSAWVKMNGTWKEDVMPKGVVSGGWKEFMSYFDSIYLSTFNCNAKLLTATGETIWKRAENDGGSAHFDPINKYFYSIGSGNSVRGGLLIKYGTDGKRIWTLELEGHGYHVCVDRQGYIYAASSYNLYKIDPESRAILWKRIYSSQTRKVVVDKEGYVYLHYGSPSISGDNYIIKLDSKGERLWSKKYGYNIGGLTVDSQLQVYVGNIRGSVSKLDGITGDFIWSWSDYYVESAMNILLQNDSILTVRYVSPTYEYITYEVNTATGKTIRERRSNIFPGTFDADGSFYVEGENNGVSKYNRSYIKIWDSDSISRYGGYSFALDRGNRSTFPENY